MLVNMKCGTIRLRNTANQRAGRLGNACAPCMLQSLAPPAIRAAPTFDAALFDAWEKVLVARMVLFASLGGRSMSKERLLACVATSSAWQSFCAGPVDTTIISFVRAPLLAVVHVTSQRRGQH